MSFMAIQIVCVLLFLYFILEKFCAKTLQHRIANLLQLNILYHDPLEYTTYNVWLF